MFSRVRGSRGLFSVGTEFCGRWGRHVFWLGTLRVEQQSSRGIWVGRLGWRCDLVSPSPWGGGTSPG